MKTLDVMGNKITVLGMTFLSKILFIGSLTIVLIGSEVLANQNEYADMSLEELLNVEITTASRQPQRVSQAPSIVRVITAEQIRRRGCESVGEALQAVPGIHLIDDHLSYNLGVRGINGGMRGWSRVVKVMIDGQPVSYRPSTENWLGKELIPIRAIERIEIVVGPASALYGANAYLGVANIITKDGADLEGGLLTITGGRENGNSSLDGDFVIGGKTGNATFVLAAAISESDRSGLLLPESSPNLDDYGDERSANDFARPKSLLGRVTYRSPSVGEIELLGNLQHHDRYGEFQDWGILTHENRISLHNWFVRGKYGRNLGSKLLAKISLALAEGAPTSEDHLDIGSPLYWKKRDTGYRAIDLAAETEYEWTPQGTMTLGLDYTRDQQNLQSVYSVFKQDFGSRKKGDVVLDVPAQGDTIFANVGFFGQGVWRATRSMWLTVGLRYDDHNIYGNTLNSRVGIVYEFKDRRYWKILYGTSFKAPAPFQLFAKPLKSGGIVGNPDLRPEEARTFEGAIGFVNTEHLSGSVNAFLSVVHEKVEFIYHRGNLVAQNLGDLESRGIELELRCKVGHLLGCTHLSYQKTEMASGQSGNENLGLYPDWIWYFSLGYTVPAYYLNINLQQRYVGERVASQSNAAENPEGAYNLDAYGICTLTLSTEGLSLAGSKETILSLKVDNVADKRYAEPGYNGIDFPSLGRRFVFGITQQF